MTTRFLARSAALATILLSTPVVLEAQDGWNLPIDRNRTIRAGETRSSSLDGSDRKLEDGSYYEAWFFEGRAGQRITVTMKAGSFDAYLAIGRHNGDMLESNDDYESGTTNAQVSVTLPSSGMYMIRANSLGENETGDYLLSVEEGGSGGSSGGSSVAQALATPSSSARMLQSGRQVGGTLDSGDPKLDDDSHYETWFVNLSAGQRITVTMRSSAFDTYLSIGKSGGSERDESNDDFESGSTDSQLEFTAPSAGTYVVIANSLGEGETGAYTLVATISGGSGGSSNSGGGALTATRSISLGQTVSGELTSSSLKRADDSFYEGWTLQAPAGSRITVTLRSGDFDSYLTIQDVTGEDLGSDDDSGGERDAEVTVTVPSNGRIVIIANTLSEGETGRYTLRVVRAN
jgi:hypothetical protein